MDAFTYAGLPQRRQRVWIVGTNKFATKSTWDSNDRQFDHIQPIVKSCGDLMLNLDWTKKIISAGWPNDDNDNVCFFKVYVFPRLLRKVPVSKTFAVGQEHQVEQLLGKEQWTLFESNMIYYWLLTTARRIDEFQIVSDYPCCPSVEIWSWS